MLKPPLLIWLIVICYKFCGFNALALRLPSALSILGMFFYAIKFARLTGKKDEILLACFMLLSCKALFGIHTGLTGDFDALLLFLLLASSYYFFSYIEYGAKAGIYMAALFTGLAFYAKGPRCPDLYPGLFCFMDFWQRVG